MLTINELGEFGIRDDSPVQMCAEQAAFYDQMVDELREAVFGDEEGGGE